MHQPGTVLQSPLSQPPQQQICIEMPTLLVPEPPAAPNSPLHLTKAALVQLQLQTVQHRQLLLIPLLVADSQQLLELEMMLLHPHPHWQLLECRGQCMSFTREL
jgi:hypothetical protein